MDQDRDAPNGQSFGEKPPSVPPGIERALAAAVIGILALITFANVIALYFTNFSFAFTEEISVFLMVVMALLSAAAAFADNRHIRMTFVVERLSASAARMVELLTLACGVGLFGWLCWLTARYAFDTWRFEETSPGIGVPIWIYWIWIPVLTGVIALRL
ncbi:MAG: TRAP transporter small permease, partial [Alphaproteobacteria bacterium]|nr:TRAP transporter small permease [Alphaproteobacteria bacterium]